jgi:hypothetical protein
MSSQLLIEAAGRGTVLTVVVGVATGAKVLASVLRTWIEQASRTRRLIRALEDSRPNQRPGIITACSQLEGRSAGKSGSDASDRVLPAHRHPRPPVPIVQNKRDRERHRD